MRNGARLISVIARSRTCRQQSIRSNMSLRTLPSRRKKLANYRKLKNKLSPRGRSSKVLVILLLLVARILLQHRSLRISQSQRRKKKKRKKLTNQMRRRRKRTGARSKINRLSRMRKRIRCINKLQSGKINRFKVSRNRLKISRAKQRLLKCQL